MLYLGNGNKNSAQGIKGEAADITPSSPYGIAVDSKGNLYIADSGNNRILKVDTSGMKTIIAGTGACGYGGDGGAAVSAQLCGPQGISLDSQGNIYITDNFNHVIRKIDANGIITTAAGSGNMGFSGDGRNATDANVWFFDPYGVAVDADGNLYIADTGNQRIRKVNQNGTIQTIAGSGTCSKWYPTSPGYSGDDGPANVAKLSMPTSVSIDKAGNVFIADAGNHRIRKISTSGIITTVAGNGTAGYSGDGGLAINAQLNYPYGVTVDEEGSLLIADSGNNLIRKVGPDGIITTISATSLTLDFPTSAVVDSGNKLYISSTGNNRIWEMEPTLPAFSGEDVLIASDDGRQLYVFNDSGRHLRTVETTTSIVKYEFIYNAAGYLIGISDKNGNTTTIERDTIGNPTAIIAPGGQKTGLTLDENGYLASIINPNSETTQLSYTDDGLLTSLTDPKGNIHKFTYDDLGKVVKDEDPTGGYKELSKTTMNNGETSTVVLTTAEGRSTTFVTEKLSTGGSSHKVTDPSGLTTTTETDTDVTSTSTGPDGTITTTTVGPDPRFGMQAPITTSMTIKTPGGLTYSLSGGRTVTLSDSNNPLSIITMTDTTTVNSKTFTSTYDAATKKITATSPVGRKRYTLLDDKGRVAQEQITGLEGVSYSYDEKGRMTGLTQGTRTTTIVYDSLNQIESITDASDRTVSFDYDLAGLVTTQTLPDGRIIAYSYDANGNVTSITPPGRPSHNFTFDPRDLETYYNPPSGSPLLQGEGQGEGGVWSTQFAYNLDKQLTQIIRPDGQTISLNYDNGGRLSAMILPSGQLTYSYNSTTGNLSSVAAPGETLWYSYDGSLLTGTAWTGSISGSVGFNYNNDFRITSQSVNGANSVSYSYDNDGLMIGAGSLSISRNTQNDLTTGSTLGSVTDNFTYSTFGEPSRYTANYSGSTLLDVQYTRDNLGRITSKTETINGATNAYAYTYDTAGRLTDVSTNGVNTAHYDYDTNGNRVGWVKPTDSGTATYDNQDRLVSYGSTYYTYTANGELQSQTTSGQTTTYNYDVLGNLKAATLADGTTIEYLVDGQSRRIGKKVNGAFAQGFLYESQLRPVAELDGSGNILSRFVYPNKANVPEYMVKGGVTYRIITDHLGSPRLVVNSSTGAIAQQMDYDEFGNVTNDTNPGFQPFGFAGGLYDRDTKLTRFGARDYDAETGKWTAKDPIGFRGGDTNLLAYVGNSPLNRIDPFGLKITNATGQPIRVKSEDQDNTYTTLQSSETSGPVDGAVVGNEVIKVTDNVDVTLVIDPNTGLVAALYDTSWDQIRDAIQNLPYILTGGDTSGVYDYDYFTGEHTGWKDPERISCH